MLYIRRIFIITNICVVILKPKLLWSVVCKVTLLFDNNM